jgi:hypothetical protein
MKLIADCHPSLIHLSNMLGESPEAARTTVGGDKEIDLPTIVATRVSE